MAHDETPVHLLDVSPIQPDVDKIYGLIHAWDHRCQSPGDCPRRAGVKRFAALLVGPRGRRGKSSFYNLKSGKRLGYAFAAQIAAALHVEVADITLPETAGTDEDPQPQAEAA